MKRFIICLVIMATLISGGAFASPQDEFIDRMAPVAQEILPGYGLWPSVFIAQAALESGWGRSWLATTANNYFGRKCLELPCIEIKTPEYRRGQQMIEAHSFQIYDSLPAAVHGYCQQFFRRWESGVLIYNMDASTPETFIRSVAPRYATDPRYADKVIRIINEYDLRRFD